MEQKQYSESDLLTMFKLSSSLSTTNMTLFDAQGCLRNYETPEDILEEFYEIRKRFYSARKEHLLKEPKAKVNRLENKTRFIGEVLEETLVLRNAAKDDVVASTTEIQVILVSKKITI